jgi:hypothetical protein
LERVLANDPTSSAWKAEARLYTKPAWRRDESTIPTAPSRRRFSNPRSPPDELSLQNWRSRQKTSPATLVLGDAAQHVNQVAVKRLRADNRTPACFTNTCHAREREHPEYHDSTRFAALRRSRRLPGLPHRFVESPRLDPRFFAGMTPAGA